MEMHERYNFNKAQKNGTECICPICGDTFVKKQTPQAFCNDKAKEVKCSIAYRDVINFFKRNVPADILKQRGII